MLFLIGFMLLMGAVDSLNPFTIAVLILLLGILKNPNRILIYVAGVLSVYIVGGIAIFTGFSAVSDFLVEQFALIPAPVLYGIEGISGLILVIYGILEWRKQSQKKQVSKSLDISTWALIVLGAGGTLTDLPTAIPYLGFIAKMTEVRLDIFTAILFLIVYSFVYTFPLFLIWILYLKFRDRIQDKMGLVVKRVGGANNYIMLIFSQIIGIGFILDSALFFLGVPIAW